MDLFIGFKYLLMQSFASALKSNLLLSILLSFFSLRRVLFTMFPVNKTSNSFFGFGLWSKSVAGLYSFWLFIHSNVWLCFASDWIDYQVCFLEYLIELNYFFCHTAPTNSGFVLGLTLCFPKYYILQVVFHFHLVTVWLQYLSD